MYIAIAGNIGSGKTTLTRRLADHYGWTPKFESVEDNPYLADYYKDIPRWAFNMEVFFLRQRFKDMLAISRSDITVVQDRSIFEGVYVFAANNYRMGSMDERDFTTYMELFECMMSVVRKPDLMVYLKASLPRLVDHIQQRSRSYEEKMPIEYLRNLNRLYDDFIFNKYDGRKLIVETDHLDLRDNEDDFHNLTEQINKELCI
ncbi:MAG: deoxynucleoside kinase [Bacteroidales bacterium]|nr:deoxynucleoside kinase [Bacteroidales bacterium]MDY4706616.1 deoxynucleoside kinase [Prevotella sp.]MCI7653371.1 deoxynucleoside kinase [Bacteroidales bacterium]MDD7705727.1 deoxynucleoside kinase [Bacteroidales bacterium]MDY4952778.1 deoxynucleoside kinase [Prevotella sp.]